jgi:hypothetical protein
MAALMNLMEIVSQVSPDGWVEGIAAIVISVLSWYLGRRKERSKNRRGR